MGVGTGSTILRRMVRVNAALLRWSGRGLGGLQQQSEVQQPVARLSPPQELRLHCSRPHRPLQVLLRYRRGCYRCGVQFRQDKGTASKYLNEDNITVKSGLFLVLFFAIKSFFFVPRTESFWLELKRFSDRYASLHIHIGTWLMSYKDQCHDKMVSLLHRKTVGSKIKRCMKRKVLSTADRVITDCKRSYSGTKSNTNIFSYGRSNLKLCRSPDNQSSLLSFLSDRSGTFLTVKVVFTSLL